MCKDYMCKADPRKVGSAECFVCVDIHDSNRPFLMTHTDKPDHKLTSKM